MAFKGPFLLKPFYGSISCTSARPAQTEFFPALLLCQQHADRPCTCIFLPWSTVKMGRVRHCLPSPPVILLNERNWKEPPGVVFSLCWHLAAGHLDCSVFSYKARHGLCSSLPQRAALEPALLLVILPYLLNLGSEVVFLAEIGN